MTERKPPGTSFETWVDKQIREAMDRGEFDNLPGAGKPIPGLAGPDDEWWWIGPKLRREGVGGGAALPTPLRLRKEIEELPETVAVLSSERAVRDTVERLNKRITDWLLVPSGPQVIVVPVDVDEVVAGWQLRRAAAQPPVEPVAEPPQRPRRRSRWLRRSRRPSA